MQQKYKYSQDEIKTAILSSFNNFSECAEALGIDRSTLTRNINTASSKFINRLVDAGVSFSIKSKREMELENEIKDLKNEIRELRAQVEYSKEIIKVLSVQYDNSTKNLEVISKGIKKG